MIPRPRADAFVRNDRLIEYLLFCDEPPLPSHVSGTTEFTEHSPGEQLRKRSSVRCVTLIYKNSCSSILQLLDSQFSV